MVKKFLAAILALCLIMPTAYADAEIKTGSLIEGYCFDTPGVLPVGVSQGPHKAAYAVAEEPKFVVTDDEMLVYDGTSFAGTKGINRDHNIRLYFDYQKPTADMITLGLDLRFDETFLKTYYRIRFGNKDWTSGNEVLLFQLTETGELSVNGGTGSKMLELGENYRVAIVIEPTDNEPETQKVYKETIYVNEEYVGEGTFTAVDTGIYRSFLSIFPVASDLTYKSSKVFVDNVRVVEGNYIYKLNMAIDGQREYTVPRHGRSIRKQYKITYWGGETVSAEWSLDGNPQGISIDKNGMMEVSSEVVPGSYTIQAVIESQVLKHDIIVENIEYIYSISGTDEITVSSNTQTERYLLSDQFGNSEEAIWSVSPLTPYVTVSADGVLKVSPEAEQGDYVLTAISKYDTSISGEKTLSLVAPIYHIEGPTVITTPGLDVTSNIHFVLKDEKGNVKDAIWSVEDDALLIANDGVLSVDAMSKSDTYTIFAQCDGVSYEQKISLQKATVYNYENEALGGLPTGWLKTHVATVCEENGNKYVHSENGRFQKYFLNTEDCVVGTMQWKMRIPADGRATRMIYIVGSTYNWYFSLTIREENGNAVIIHQGVEVARTSFDKWIDFRTEHDNTAANTITLVVDGKKCGTFRPLSSGVGPTDLRLFSLEHVDIDDLMYYSGIPASKEIHTNIGNTITIPSMGNITEMAMGAKLVVDGEITNHPVNCTLQESYNGVSIENNVIYVTDEAVVGDIVITADAGYEKKDFNVKLINSIHTSGNVTLGADYAKLNPLIINVDLSNSENGQSIKVTPLHIYTMRNGYIMKNGEGLGVAVNGDSVLKFMLAGNHYCVSVDGNVLDEGELFDTLTSIENNLGDIYVGSPLKGAKGVLTTKVGGAAYVGQRVYADYKYYDETGSTKYVVQINWFVDGNHAGEGDRLVLKGNYKNKSVYYTVEIKSVDLATLLAKGKSEEKIISDFISVTGSNNSATVSAENIWGDKEIIICVVTEKKGDVFPEIVSYYQALSAGQNINMPIKLGGDINKIFIADRVTRQPLSLIQTVNE